MNELARRIVTGLLGAGLLIFFMVFSSKTYALVFALIGILSLFEYHQLLRKGKFGFLELSYHFFWPFLYLGLPIAIVLELGIFSPENHDWHPVFAVLLLIWLSDSGAYFIGRRFGKRPLAPSISPKKTWEGFWGGLSMALVAGLIIGLVGGPLKSIAFFNYEGGPIFWLLTALVVAVFGTLGDLKESIFKRRVGVKDSSNFLPGHGGFLDRFDAFFYALPFAFGFWTLWLEFCQ